MADDPQWLFVYGTLRRAAHSRMGRWLARHASHAGDARLRGRLYEVNGYPGLIESDRPAEWVTGELYRLRNPRDVLAVLDDYEECSPRFPEPREYVRKQLPVRVRSRRWRPAWVYIFNRDVARLPKIASGDYLRRRGGSGFSRPHG